MWFVLSAATAMCFGLRNILYHWSSQQPIKRNLMLMSVYMSGTLVSLIASWVLGQAWTFSVCIGMIMGLFSFISNAAMYKGFSEGKASIVAMFLGLPPVVVVLLAYLIWGEKLSIWQISAFLIIVLGMVLIRYSNEISFRNLQGAGWGILTMLFFGFTDLTSKQAILSGAAVLPTLVFMYGTGMLLFGIVWFVQEAKSRSALQIASVLQVGGDGASTLIPKAAVMKLAAWSKRKTLFWGMSVGIINVAGMFFMMPALKIGMTGLVSAIASTNVILVLLYARFGLKEKFSRMELSGMLCAFVGVIIIRIAG
jgi:drug/metabolite transporter (DMT)-like permease